jgi:hypothetical protein
MITLRKAAQEYLTLRRSLGFKLRDRRQAVARLR